MIFHTMSGLFAISVFFGEELREVFFQGFNQFSDHLSDNFPDDMSKKNHFIFFGKTFDQIFGQVFDQIFGQVFDQGLGEGKTMNTKYSTTRPKGKT